MWHKWSSKIKCWWLNILISATTLSTDDKYMLMASKRYNDMGYILYVIPVLSNFNISFFIKCGGYCLYTHCIYLDSNDVNKNEKLS